MRATTRPARARSGRGAGRPGVDVRRTGGVGSLRRAGSSRSGRPRTRRSGPHLGRAQVRVRRRRADLARPTWSRTGWCRGPRSARSWRQIARAGGRVRGPGGQRVPRGRRQPAPAGPLRHASPGSGARAEEVSGAILELCIEHGGSITGEHGVGHGQAQGHAEDVQPEDLGTMKLLRRAFDPEGLCNPGKIVPTPRLCGEPSGTTGACTRWSTAVRRSYSDALRSNFD